jgi:CubicO group peptidase (beta-lactamase class C family)
MRYLIALLLIIWAGPASAQGTPDQGPDFARFEAAAAEAWARDSTGSVTIGMVRDGQIVASRSFGLNRSGGSPADLRTIYRIGSVTKSITAVMLLQLVEAGTVRLTDPVERYVPEIAALRGRPAGSPPITLVQLATHTGGLAGEPEGEGFDTGPASHWEGKLLAALPATSYQHEPGTRFSYSNIGYGILALALSRAARKPYPDYVAERIFRPLGMTDTSFALAPRDRARLATGYMVEGRETSDAESERGHAGRGYKLPVGGIYTTGADLAKLVAFLMGNGPEQVLRRATLETASRSLITVDRNMGEGYGTGFQLFTNGDVVLQGHGGGMPGYRALQVFDRQSKTGFFVLRSALGGRFGDPVLMVFRAYGEQ